MNAICAKCRWVHKVGSTGQFWECRDPQVYFPETDPVTGRQEGASVYCREANKGLICHRFIRASLLRRILKAGYCG